MAPTKTTTKLPTVPAPTKASAPPMRMRALRCDDPTWEDAMAQAREDGLDLSEVVRHYLREYGAPQRKRK